MADQTPTAANCVRCKKDFELFAPKHEIVQGDTMTAIVWVHPELQKCPYCGLGYRMVINQIKGFGMAFIPIQTENDAGIVVADPNALSKLKKPH